MTGMLWCSCDIDIGEAVAVDVAGCAFGAFTGEHFWQVAFVEEVVIVAFLVAVEGCGDGGEEGRLSF